MLTIYETILMLKNIPKEQLAGSIRRVSNVILKRDGFFRDIQYLGFQQTPYRHSKNKSPHWNANYIFLEYNVTKHLMKEICDEWHRDRDVIKYTVFPSTDKKIIHFDQCTFEDEMKPVPYRPQVIKLVKSAKRFANAHSKKKDLKMSTTFYPFQR